MGFQPSRNGAVVCQETNDSGEIYVRRYPHVFASHGPSRATNSWDVWMQLNLLDC
jgi:hypothetical protein